MPLFTPPTKMKRKGGMYETDYGYNYDITQDPEVPNVGSYGMAENQKKLDAVYGQIEGVYADLIKSGRQQQAFALRDAADKFRRVGAKYGVNSFQRIRALKDLEGTMNVAAQAAEGRLNQQKLADLRGTLSQMAGMSTQMFGQAMQTADFRERKLASLRGAEKTMPAFRSIKSKTAPKFDTAAAMRSKASANSGIPPWMQEASDRNRQANDLANSFRRTGEGIMGRTSYGIGQGDIASPLEQARGMIARKELGYTTGGPPQALSPIILPGAGTSRSPVTGGTREYNIPPKVTAGATQTSTPRKVGVSPQSSNYFGAESSAGWTYGSPFSQGTFTINPKTGKRKLTASAW